MITAKALVVLEEIATNPHHGAAVGISKKVGMGREAAQNAITFLRQAGLVETITYKTGSKAFGKILRPTETGYHLLKTRTSILLNELNSYLILNSNSFINKKIGFGEAKRGEEAMSDEWYSLGQLEQDPEEMAELKRRDKERKDREYRESRNAKAEATMAANINRSPDHWSIDNAVYEFANRMIRWDITPWEGSRAVFKTAYAKARKNYGTTGDIEVKMMDIFFGRLDHEKKVKDSDMVWRLFLRDFNSLKVIAEQSTITKEDVAKAKEISNKQMERF